MSRHCIADQPGKGERPCHCTVGCRTSDPPWRPAGANASMGDGAGSFQRAQSLPTGGSNTYAVVVGDLAADGKMDLAVRGSPPGPPGPPGYWGYYGSSPGTPGPPATSAVTVLLGHGDGTFAA